MQSVEKILLSVLSMLAEPNDESGANVDVSSRVAYCVVTKHTSDVCIPLSFTSLTSFAGGYIATYIALATC